MPTTSSSDPNIVATDKARDQLGKGWLQTQREKTRLSSAIDSLTVGFLIIDDQNKIVKRNPAVNSILGVSDEGEWSIASIHSKLAGELDLELTCKKCLLERRALGPFDVIFQKKYLRLFVNPIEILKDSVALFGVSILIEDVTADKIMLEAKDKYIGVAANELKEPIMSLKKISESLGEISKISILEPKLKEEISILQNTAMNLFQAVNDYFSLVNFDRGKIPYKKGKFLINLLVNEVLVEYKPKADMKSLSLESVEIEREVPEVIADKNRVRQVLASLVDNAIKFSTSGSVTVFVGKKDTFLKVSVKDSGVGVEPERRANIFRKSVKETGEISISLYVSRLLVEEMGGEIYLEESQVGSGSTFTFTLPIAYNT